MNEVIHLTDFVFLVFRYIPGNENPMTYYVRPGVKVDKTQSDERKVTLRRLTIESTGRYRCEVSTEAPSFATVSSFNDMYVVGKFEIISYLFFADFNAVES